MKKLFTLLLMGVSLCLSAGTLATSHPKEEVVLLNSISTNCSFNVERIAVPLCTHDVISQEFSEYLVFINKNEMRARISQNYQLTKGKEVTRYIESIKTELGNYKAIEEFISSNLEDFDDKFALPLTDGLPWSKATIAPDHSTLTIRTKLFDMETSESIVEGGRLRGKIIVDQTCDELEVDILFNDNMKLEVISNT